MFPSQYPKFPFVSQENFRCSHILSLSEIQIYLVRPCRHGHGEITEIAGRNRRHYTIELEFYYACILKLIYIGAKMRGLGIRQRDRLGMRVWKLKNKARIKKKGNPWKVIGNSFREQQ